jgi:hypothetical protein
MEATMNGAATLTVGTATPHSLTIETAPHSPLARSIFGSTIYLPGGVTTPVSPSLHHGVTAPESSRPWWQLAFAPSSDAALSRNIRHYHTHSLGRQISVAQGYLANINSGLETLQAREVRLQELIFSIHQMMTEEYKEDLYNQFQGVSDAIDALQQKKTIWEKYLKGLERIHQNHLDATNRSFYKKIQLGVEMVAFYVSRALAICAFATQFTLGPSSPITIGFNITLSIVSFLTPYYRNKEAYLYAPMEAAGIPNLNPGMLDLEMGVLAEQRTDAMDIASIMSPPSSAEPPQAHLAPQQEDGIEAKHKKAKYIIGIIGFYASRLLGVCAFSLQFALGASNAATIGFNIALSVVSFITPYHRSGEKKNASTATETEISPPLSPTSTSRPSISRPSSPTAPEATVLTRGRRSLSPQVSEDSAPDVPGPSSRREVVIDIPTQQPNTDVSALANVSLSAVSV